MNISEIKNLDIANGPGVRVSVWVSGCDRRCTGCFNEAAWNYENGKPYETEKQTILKSLRYPAVCGLSVLGGEPLAAANLDGVLDLCSSVKTLDASKTIWIFSGYTWEDLLLRKRKEKALAKILEKTDVLIDGPFIENEKSLTLAFRGSKNQRLIDVKKSLEKGAVVLVDESVFSLRYVNNVDKRE